MATKDEEAGLSTNGQSAHIEPISKTQVTTKIELHPAFYVGYVSLDDFEHVANFGLQSMDFLQWICNFIQQVGPRYCWIPYFPNYQ